MGEYRKIAVIGAGIVGVSTALWLQRRGAEVVLIDRAGVAAGASEGNAGVMASIAMVPVLIPGMVWKAPRMLLDPAKPLFLKWADLPRLLPFFLRYVANGRADRVERIASALTDLLHDSPDQHLALSDGTGAARFVKPEGYLYGYADKASFEADAYDWDLRRRNGFTMTEMDAAAIARFDPALEGRFGYGVSCDGNGRISDPGAYVRALADSFTSAGGTILKAEVRGFREEDGRARAVLTNTGEIEADAFAVTTGAWSGPLAGALGVRVRLASERGYHLEFHDPSIRLRTPVMVASAKFVATPMEGRLRCAGIVEFGGLDRPSSRAPFDLMRRNVDRLFPDLTCSHVTEWMGNRPATTDSLPVIGQSPRLPNVFLGYGHQHIGLTGGPKTGRWLAQMMTGAKVNADLAPFAPDRLG